MRPPDQDLANRRPVWVALSNLFLDTEHADGTRDHLACILAASAYSTGALRAILRDEVYPVCAPNLLAVAGNWSGFDLDWLEPRILARPPARRRWPAWMRPGWHAIAAEAEDLFARIDRLRAIPPPSSPS